MSKITIFNMNGDRLGDLGVAEAYRAKGRANTASTKTKGQVEGGSAKPWKQKGTGRARAGSIRSPIWRGGGVVWGPTPLRNFEKKVPLKVAQLAFRRALSEKISAGELVVVDRMSVATPKTKDVAAALKKLNAVKGALLVVDKAEKNLILAARNIKNVEVVTADSAHTYQLLRYPRIIVSQDAMAKLEARLKKSAGRSA